MLNENNLTLHLRMFNDKVRLMNQTGKQNLTLSAQEARNIHADLFDLLAQCSKLSQTNADNAVISVEFDGGKF